MLTMIHRHMMRIFLLINYLYVHVPNCMKNLGSENSTSFKDTSFRASSVEGREEGQGGGGEGEGKEGEGGRRGREKGR